ncbi:RNA-binding protein NOB1 [Neosynchiropus ocellatus]
MAQPLVEHVVADAGAFLKRASLQNFGKNIYTLRDVVNEIRDKPTRKSLAFLPYQLTWKEPSPEYVRLVTDFSKKTGDYPSLSATDIKVLALTYQLTVEHVGSQHLRKEPEMKLNVCSTQRHPETPVNIAGFHLPSKVGDPQSPLAGSLRLPCVQIKVEDPKLRQKVAAAHPEPPSRTGAPDSQEDSFNSFQFWRAPLPAIEDELLDLLEPSEVSKNTQEGMPPLPLAADSDAFNGFQFWRTPLPAIEDELLDLLKSSDASEPVEENTPGEADDDDDDEDEDDGGGWITPSNIGLVKMDSADWRTPAHVKVGCLTTDFAMQNVLVQIGLHVLSVDGMLIKQARNYILRCHACFKTTSNMNKQFCPHCGNKTLKKVAVTLSEDGSVQMHFSKNPKVLNTRGLRHTLPLPQGGKHSSNPQLVEDQRFPQQRLSQKARQKTDVFDPDYVSGSSPFSQNDIYSRAASLNLRDGQCGAGRRRVNPNASRKKFVKKK